MDEDLAIINTNTRNEKIKSFFVNNKKKLITFLLLLVVILLSFFAFKEYKEIQKKELSDKFNAIIIDYSSQEKEKTKNELIDIIKKKDSTYSPLSLYFIIDNNLTQDKELVNELFNILIEKTKLEREIKNLIIYKKGLYNADNVNEIQLLNILNPLINSESVWKSHALYLIAEFFYSKNEKKKSKEFFEKIITLENVNEDIITESRKRLNRDLSE